MKFCDIFSVRKVIKDTRFSGKKPRGWQQKRERQKRRGFLQIFLMTLGSTLEECCIYSDYKMDVCLVYVNTTLRELVLYLYCFSRYRRMYFLEESPVERTHSEFVTSEFPLLADF
jgi:hypothetical protein